MFIIFRIKNDGLNHEERTLVVVDTGGLAGSEPLGSAAAGDIYLNVAHFLSGF